MELLAMMKGKWLRVAVIGITLLLAIPIFTVAQEGGTQPAPTEATDGAPPPELAEDEPVAAEAPEPIVEEVDQSKWEEVAKYHYFILHSTDPDLPTEQWQIVGRFAANDSANEYGYDYEQPGYFHFFKTEPAGPGKDERYFFYSKNNPNHVPKKAIYRIKLSQVTEVVPIEPAPPEPETTMPVPEISPPVIEIPITKPDDLVLPEDFRVEDRKNDEGGTIAVIWMPTTSEDVLVKVPPEEPAVPAEPSAAPEIITHLDRVRIDAWLYAPEESGPESINMTIDLRPLGGEEKAILTFENIVDNPTKFDHGLGWHFSGEFTINDGDGEPKIGKGLLLARAEGANSVYKGHVKYAKAPGIPLDKTQDEETYPDNRYEHYFKLGMDTYDHAGFPRWVMEHDPPVGIVASPNGFNDARLNSFLYAFLLAVSILTFIFRARAGKALFVRHIAGLDHVEDAIGRATEMGKPILFVPGIETMSHIATIAATNILGQVAKRVADYDSQVLVPNRDPIVMTVCQEVVQEAFIDAGRPDQYVKDNIFFLTDDQFSFTAAVDGIMVREKPATNLFMGHFYAESLILAETGAGTGAIQIAGTDALAQLPFFITACDYTLIGEELYAASAYLSREPLLLGSLKGQDLGKAVLIIWLVLGVLEITFLRSSFLAILFSSPL